MEEQGPVEKDSDCSNPFLPRTLRSGKDFPDRPDGQAGGADIVDAKNGSVSADAGGNAGNHTGIAISRIGETQHLADDSFPGYREENGAVESSQLPQFTENRQIIIPLFSEI
jgi:hypothetical protein